MHWLVAFRHDQRSWDVCNRVVNKGAAVAGHIKLWLPVFHIGYWKSMLSTLQCICKSCSSILLPEEEFRTYLRRMRSVMLPAWNPACQTTAPFDCHACVACPEHTWIPSRGHSSSLLE